MTSSVVLLVEDDADLRLTTRLVLERQGFTVVTAEDGVDALDRLRDQSVDVAVVDVLMPRMDGLTLLRELRTSVEHAELPVLLLTARDLPSDQVGGLDAGADDYVVKPFDSAVLAARLRVLLRHRGPSAAPTWHELGELRIDREGMVVERAGQPVELSATEFRLLDALLEHAGQVLSREQLLHLVWGSADWGEPRVVDVNVQRLRAKIGADKIVTLRGSGYKLVR
ncbi:DNA-binding response OmpR family regulator [Propionicimonas paludicola]|uniref:DNA-binding response OmpR family regulator n=1 Tax=Propionicimonas paludicola TaxID=185243 RepID=A0A2A9CTG6_9ACTN|nr:response regulator transcription factor [Propionicimonas paludicola]PFG17451.1 DNA-binding response OmpR family regulator [Propionicimonas paludicola]